MADALDVLIDCGIDAQEAGRLLRLTAQREKNSITPADRPFSAGEMAAWAELTDADIERARADWFTSRAIPTWAKRLLDSGERE